jgi:hypothetical protein
MSQAQVPRLLRMSRSPSSDDRPQAIWTPALSIVKPEDAKLIEHDQLLDARNGVGCGRNRS